MKVVVIALACLHKNYVAAWKTVEESIVSLELSWFKDRVGIVDEHSSKTAVAPTQNEAQCCGSALRKLCKDVLNTFHLACLRLLIDLLKS